MSRILRPGLVDAAFLLILGVLGLVAFHGTFLGWGYLEVGVGGLLLGCAASAVVLRLRLPLVLALALVLVIFFVLGGPVALHGLGSSYVVPAPKAWSQLNDSAFHGWKDLLTTLPPIDDPTLLVIPFLLGLTAGALGLVIASRVRWDPAPVLVPVALLASVILLGVESPRRTAIDAAVFAVAAVAWLIVRSRRERNLQTAQSGRLLSRRLTAAGLCLAAAAVGLAVGGHLPGVAAQRVVLRAHVVPPFNVGQYPSPLAGYRRFTKGYAEGKANAAQELFDKPLFEVSGLAPGSRIRIAALDSYNGIIWGAGNIAGSGGQPLTADDTDVFNKVSRVIDNPAVGKTVTAHVTVLTDALGPSWVWLPTSGDLTGITFHIPDELQGSTDFRYNLDSSTGVLPDGLPQHSQYTFTAVQPDDRLSSSTPMAAGALPGAAAQTQFERLATTWAGRAATPLQQVRAVADYLKRNGHLTDGQGDFQGFTAGHSIYRLALFTQAAGELAGDDEQFAALMALMSNNLGVPARVVVGAVVPANHVVHGSDMHAWVELQAADGSWKTLPDSAFMPTTPPQQQHQQPQHTVAASVIPPPAPVHPPATAGEPLDSGLNHRASPAKKHHGFLHAPAFVIAILRYVGLPVLVILALCMGIVGLKAERRRRRRSRGTPTRRLGAAWHELLDHARDFGHSVPPRATRREQAAALPLPELTASARRADAAMFAREAPTEDIVAGYWAHVDDLRRAIASEYGRRARIRAALNLSTLRLRRGYEG